MITWPIKWPPWSSILLDIKTGAEAAVNIKAGALVKELTMPMPNKTQMGANIVDFWETTNLNAIQKRGTLRME